MYNFDHFVRFLFVCRLEVVNSILRELEPHTYTFEAYNCAFMLDLYTIISNGCIVMSNSYTIKANSCKITLFTFAIVNIFYEFGIFCAFSLIYPNFCYMYKIWFSRCLISIGFVESFSLIV